MCIRDRARSLCKPAVRVFAANAAVAREIRGYRPDVETLWAPALLQGDRSQGRLHVLTFGMAHKRALACFAQLREVLEACGGDYTLAASTGLHEGTTWEQAEAQTDQLAAIFGSRLRRLGYLEDDGLAVALHQAPFVALFFDPAARENSTTLWAACEAGRNIITNLDGDSPPTLVHGRTVLDVHRLQPSDFYGTAARALHPFRAVEPYTWDRLLARVATASRVATARACLLYTSDAADE